MECTTKKIAIRFLGWLLSKVWRQLFSGVIVDIESLKSTIAKIKWKAGKHFDAPRVQTDYSKQPLRANWASALRALQS